jgi:hypothetical protein
VPVGVEVNVSRGLAKLGRVKDLLTPREILEGIGQRQLYWVGINLQSAGSQGEGRWQHMAAITLERRPLRPSPHHFSSPYQTLLQQSPVMEVRGEEAVAVGTNARYAVYHHFGARDGGWVLPARPLLPSPGKARDTAQEFLRELVRQIGAAGRAR